MRVTGFPPREAIGSLSATTSNWPTLSVGSRTASMSRRSLIVAARLVALSLERLQVLQ